MTKERKILLKNLLKQYKQSLQQSDYPKLKKYEKQYKDRGYWGLIISINKIAHALDQMKYWFPKIKEENPAFFNDVHQTLIDLINNTINKYT